MNDEERYATLLERMRSRETALGEASARAVDTYVSPRWFVDERSHLFRRVIRVAALSIELPSTGAYVSFVSHGVPVLLTRAADGQVRAFVNACRHRGAQLVTDASGEGCRRLSCPYHAWTYDLEGHLVGVPGRKAFFPDLELAETGLLALPAVEHAGVIWYRLTPGEPIDLEAELGPVLLEGLRELNLGQCTQSGRTRLPVAANWKLFAEGVRENYHFSTTHAETIGRVFVRNVMTVETHGCHSRITLPRRDLVEAVAHSARLEQGADTMYVLFPGTTFIAGREGITMLRVEPEAPDRSVVEISTLARPGTAADDALRARHHRHVCRIFGEDLVRLESVQRGLDSGLVEEVRFGRQEYLLGLFHDHIRARLATP